MSDAKRSAASPMEQLIGFVDWERKNNPGHRHVAEWALAEIERLHAALLQRQQGTVGTMTEQELRAAAHELTVRADRMAAARSRTDDVDG